MTQPSPKRPYHSIHDAYTDYDARIVPVDAGPTQRKETRLAFYAGAATMFGLLFAAVDGDDGEDAEMLRMKRLNRELVEFSEKVKRGEA